jgi:hypothetical protein
LTPEGKIKSDILSYLEKQGIYCWNNPTGAVQVRPNQWYRFGKVGSSDIIGILPDGKFLAVEVKTRQGRLSPAQREFLKGITERGGLAVCVCSVGELHRELVKVGAVTDLFSV